MIKFFKFYKFKIIEFFLINYLFFFSFIVFEILGTIVLSTSFLGVVSYFSEKPINILNFIIIENSLQILLFVCINILFAIILKISSRLTISKLLNLSNLDNDHKLLAINRLFILSTAGNFVTIVLLFIILLINFFDFFIFLILNFIFLLYPLTKNGRWITHINKKDMVQKTSSHFFVSKNSEILSIIFFFLSLLYCVFSHYIINDNLIKYIFLIICARFFMGSFNENIRLLFVWKNQNNIEE